MSLGKVDASSRIAALLANFTYLSSISRQQSNATLEQLTYFTYFIILKSKKTSKRRIRKFNCEHKQRASLSDNATATDLSTHCYKTICESAGRTPLLLFTLLLLRLPLEFRLNSFALPFEFRLLGESNQKFDPDPAHGAISFLRQITPEPSSPAPMYVRGGAAKAAILAGPCAGFASLTPAPSLR